MDRGGPDDPFDAAAIAGLPEDLDCGLPDRPAVGDQLAYSFPLGGRSDRAPSMLAHANAYRIEPHALRQAGELASVSSCLGSEKATQNRGFSRGADPGYGGSRSLDGDPYPLRRGSS